MLQNCEYASQRTAPLPSGQGIPGQQPEFQPGIVGGLTTWLPSSSTVQVQAPHRIPVAPVAPPQPEPHGPPQSVATIDGCKYIVVPKHNVLSVSPAMSVSGVQGRTSPRPGAVPPPGPQGPPGSSASPSGVYFVPYTNPSQYVLVNGAAGFSPNLMLGGLDQFQ